MRDTEALVRNFRTPSTSEKPPKKALPVYAQKGQRQLSDVLGTQVDVKVAKNGKGQLVVRFNNADEFDRIVNQIKGEE